MDLSMKKQALQALTKALAVMPEGAKGKVEVKSVSAEPMHDEKEETVADEMAESPATQVKEMIEGTEEHPEEAAKSLAMKTEPSIMEKLQLDDLSLEELKAIKEKLKAAGLV